MMKIRAVPVLMGLSCLLASCAGPEEHKTLQDGFAKYTSSKPDEAERIADEYITTNSRQAATPGMRRTTFAAFRG